jgi:hypothetical protein
VKRSYSSGAGSADGADEREGARIPGMMPAAADISACTGPSGWNGAVVKRKRYPCQKV